MKSNFETHDWDFNHCIESYVEYWYDCKKCGYELCTNESLSKHSELSVPSCNQVQLQKIVKDILL